MAVLISFAFSFKCYSILMILILFPLHRPLCIAGRLGERKRKRAGHDGKGKKRSLSPFPSSPSRLLFFFLIAIFIGIAIGSLCGGERAIIRISLAAICPSGPCNNCSLIFVHSNPAFINAGS